MRTSKKTVEEVFGRFCAALGKKVADSYADKGAWALDYYNGYQIVEYLPGGGESAVFSDRRLSPSEIVMMMHFAMRAIAIDRGEGQHCYWPTNKQVEVSDA
jgi:hypothetical protein